MSNNTVRFNVEIIEEQIKELVCGSHRHVLFGLIQPWSGHGAALSWFYPQGGDASMARSVPWG